MHYFGIIGFVATIFVFAVVGCYLETRAAQKRAIRRLHRAMISD